MSCWQRSSIQEWEKQQRRGQIRNGTSTAKCNCLQETVNWLMELCWFYTLGTWWPHEYSRRGPEESHKLTTKQTRSEYINKKKSCSHLAHVLVSAVAPSVGGNSLGSAHEFEKQSSASQSALQWNISLRCTSRRDGLLSKVPVSLLGCQASGGGADVDFSSWLIVR